MAKTTRTAVLAMALGGMALAGTQQVALAEQREIHTMTVLMINKAGVPEDILMRAQAETARIYGYTGVKLVWADMDSSSFDLTVIIVSSRNIEGRGALADLMGIAPGAREIPGKLAYAFYGPIEDSARQHRTDVAKILGCVTAHEIGHLLLPRDSHSQTGLMRGSWERLEIARLKAGVLTFTTKEAEMIHRKVGATRTASRLHAGADFSDL